MNQTMNLDDYVSDEEMAEFLKARKLRIAQGIVAHPPEPMPDKAEDVEVFSMDYFPGTSKYRKAISWLKGLLP